MHLRGCHPWKRRSERKTSCLSVVHLNWYTRISISITCSIPGSSEPIEGGRRKGRREPKRDYPVCLNAATVLPSYTSKSSWLNWDPAARTQKLAGCFLNKQTRSGTRAELFLTAFFDYFTPLDNWFIHTWIFLLSAAVPVVLDKKAWRLAVPETEEGFYFKNRNCYVKGENQKRSFKEQILFPLHAQTPTPTADQSVPEAIKSMDGCWWPRTAAIHWLFVCRVLSRSPLSRSLPIASSTFLKQQSERDFPK